MQSVFKAPLALTVLHLIEQGEWTLDQPIRFRADDRILPRTFSPLQDKYPAAEVEVPLRELLGLAVSQSDNAAADVVLRTIGGPKVVEDVEDYDNEAALHRDPELEPASAVQLLRRLNDAAARGADLQVCAGSPEPALHATTQINLRPRRPTWTSAAGLESCPTGLLESVNAAQMR